MAKVCAVAGCGRKMLAKGFCSGHLSRWRKYGDARPSVPLRTPQKDRGFCVVHPDRQAKSKGLCKSCYDKAWMLEDPERITRYRKVRREYSERYRAKVGKQEMSYRTRFYALKAKYGITKADYLARHLAQDGCCGICGKPQEKLNVDHHHESGKVRDLLCSRCNYIVGILECYADHVKKAVDYIARHRLG